MTGTLGVVLFIAGWNAPHSNNTVGLMLLGLTVTALSIIALGGMWVMVRFRLLQQVYAMGYRAGRDDANQSLFRSGMWIRPQRVDPT